VLLHRPPPVGPRQTNGPASHQITPDDTLGFPHFALALSFLIEWKEPRHAARLVLERSREIDGNL
jgi:hypothetical protein